MRKSGNSLVLNKRRVCVWGESPKGLVAARFQCCPTCCLLLYLLSYVLDPDCISFRIRYKFCTLGPVVNNVHGNIVVFDATTSRKKAFFLVPRFRNSFVTFWEEVKSSNAKTL